jgi:translation initiation factor 2 gamma subunit (eIF-2gamma)
MKVSEIIGICNSILKNGRFGAAVLYLAAPGQKALMAAMISSSALFNVLGRLILKCTACLFRA